MSLSFTALGGCREVGKNAFLIESAKGKFLMDYGLNVEDSSIPPEPPRDLDAVFLSHAHMDHSGAIPVLYRRGYKGNVFLTEATLSLSEMLLKDCIKVQERRGEQPHFLMPDVRRFMKRKYVSGFRKPIKLKDARAEFYDAGHIPGSCQTLLETGGKRILYTGDIKFAETELMRGADTNIKNVDVIISETTYAHKNHPDRHKLADQLKEVIQETVYNNGIAIVPSFAVGRSQELLLMLYNLGFPLYLDGMGIEATQRILLNPKSVKNSRELRKAFGRVHKIRSSRQRERIIKKPCVIITTAGMLQGGPVHYYIEKLHNSPNCSLITTGYQVEGTVGRTLMETGRYVSEDMNEKLKMRVKHFDFSAHCGRDNLLKFYKKIRPKKIVLVHGEHDQKFKKELVAMGFDAVAPENGQRIKL